MQLGPLFPDIPCIVLHNIVHRCLNDLFRCDELSLPIDYSVFGKSRQWLTCRDLPHDFVVFVQPSAMAPKKCLISGPHNGILFWLFGLEIRRIKLKSLTGLHGRGFSEIMLTSRLLTVEDRPILDITCRFPPS